MVMKAMKRIFPGVWRSGKKILTQNAVPGDRAFTPSLIKKAGKEYREWDPNRSKPAAAIVKGLKIFPICPGAKILYLGIANGTTASFFSDIIGPEGLIYGIEISERSMKDLNSIAERRSNIVPLLADARKPEEYAWVEKVDIIYQDVATNDQSEIIIRNAKQFLKQGGFAIIAIKARSIDVAKSPQEIYKQELSKLKKEFEIIEKLELDPHERDHLFVVMKN